LIRGHNVEEGRRVAKLQRQRGEREREREREREAGGDRPTTNFWQVVVYVSRA
jgi:hypothetical protein